MATKRILDRKAQKEKRQKKIAIVGAVLLVGILAVQVPRTMKMLNPPDDAAAAEPVPVATTPAPTTPAGEVPLAPPTLAGGGTEPGESGGSGGAAVDSDPAPLASAGQLVSFGTFASKDPFDQQVSAKPAAGGGSGVEGEAPAGEQGGDTAADADGGATKGDGGSKAPAPPTSATIAVDGVEEQVAVGADFPAASPLFRLVSATRSTVRIAIADGAFASGDAALTLERGEEVTLVNTADGVRYELELVSVGA